MRLLFVIPHYFGGQPGQAKPDLKGNHASVTSSTESRVGAIRRTVTSIHQTFGPSQAMIRHVDRRTEAANVQLRHDVHIVMVTSGHSHLLNEAGFSQDQCYHFSTDEQPIHLGFRCHNVLRDRWGNYDYYCFLEDDLSLSDPWFFEKLRWFNSHVGDDKLLLPNRYEKADGLAYSKCYLDGDLREEVTKPFQDVQVEPELSSTVMGKPIRFVRPLNPHSGCFFLNAAQMQKWIQQPNFGVPSSDFIGPLESAATLGIMKTFQVYKPAVEHAGFMEIEHDGDRFLSLVRVPDA